MLQHQPGCNPKAEADGLNLFRIHSHIRLGRIEKQAKVNCPTCRGPVKSNGRYKNKNRVVQRYLCQSSFCGISFSESQPLDGIRLESNEAVRIVEMLCEGVGVRAAARLARVDLKTVLRVLESAGEQCAAFLDERMRNLKVDDVQIDEIHSWVGCKQASTGKYDTERGEQYTFLAVERSTKAILSWHVGKRTAENAEMFLHDLSMRVQPGFQITSDGWQPYCEPGNGLVRQIFGNVADYALEIKRFAPKHLDGIRRYNPVVCVAVHRPHIFGNPGHDRITNNHVERTNLTMRLFNRRFTRKTMCYSRKIQNHVWSVALFVAHFNFCHVHRTLTVREEIGGLKKPCTPAMAQGVTDRPWTMAEVLGLN